MTAKLTIEIDIKAIRRFAALSDIDLTDEQEKIIIGSITLMTGKEMDEFIGDNTASLGFAALVVAKQLESE